MSMAAGEYVSVNSQADTEEADLARERKELDTNDQSEREELADIYVSRGLDPALARQVVDQLMAHDALAAFVVGTSLAFLAILGSLAARAGGARPTVGALRVTFWGALAMALTYSVGAPFGTVV